MWQSLGGMMGERCVLMNLEMMFNVFPFQQGDESMKDMNSFVERSQKRVLAFFQHVMDVQLQSSNVCILY
jgi:hypothetical protein